jgi:hypothetical protein
VSLSIACASFRGVASQAAYDPHTPAIAVSRACTTGRVPARSGRHGIPMLAAERNLKLTALVPEVGQFPKPLRWGSVTVRRLPHGCGGCSMGSRRGRDSPDAVEV